MKSFAVAVMVLVSGFATAAHAAAVGAEKATELLAHAWMIDNRCGVLDKDQRDVLTGLVARAEISLAEKVSVKAARGAIGRGRASGTAAPCDAQSAKTVKDTFSAAVAATAVTEMDVPDSAVAAQAAIPAAVVKPDAKMPEPVKSVEPEDIEAPLAETPVAKKRVKAKPVAAAAPVVVRKPIAPVRKQTAVIATKPKPLAKPVRTVAKRQKPVVVAVAAKRAVKSGSYGSTAETYYRELRCRKLSQQAVNAMYARVLREHRQAVSANGKAAVRRLLRAAENRASNGSC